MKQNIERRFIPATEIRAVEDNGSRRIVGYAALFNSRSQNLGGFVEIIQPGAFRNALKKSDIRSLFNHDPNLVLGRVKAGTLKVEEDSRGLLIENDLPETSVGNDLLVSMKRGDVDQMSFAFRVKDATWAEEGDLLVRTIQEVEELFDVSPVTYPAYTDTSVAVRSLEQWKQEKPASLPTVDIDAVLRYQAARLKQAML